MPPSAVGRQSHILGPGKAWKKTLREVCPPSLCKISERLKNMAFSLQNDCENRPGFNGGYKGHVWAGSRHKKTTFLVDDKGLFSSLSCRVNGADIRRLLHSHTFSSLSFSLSFSLSLWIHHVTSYLATRAQ
jgi:hypothetical protein